MYNINELKQAKEKINNVNITVTRKSGHKVKLEEIRQLLYDLMSINRFLFNPDSFHSFITYKRAINCNDTKKELDHRLNYTMYCIKDEISKIYNVATTCEWNENKQRYEEII